MASDNDWSIGQGLQRAITYLVFWGAVCAIGWAALVWLVTPLLNQVPNGRAVFYTHALTAAIPGLIMGHLLFKRMLEAAGFNSIVLSVLAIGFIWGAFIAGGLAADAIRPVVETREWLLIMTGATLGTIEVIYETIADR